MARFSTDLIDKLGKLLPLLLNKSSAAGEKLATVEGINRVLAKEGFDAYALVEHLKRPAAEEELKEAVAAGVKKGIEIAGNGAQTNNNGGTRPPSNKDMVAWCYQHIDDLTSQWERDFITNVRRKGVWTARQKDKLEDLYLKTGGRI